MADAESHTYYLYARSGNRLDNPIPDLGVDVYTSKDLNTWTGPKLAFELPKSGFWGRPPIWAPEVHKFGKQYFMFVTFSGRKGKKGTQILRSETPDGPFVEFSDSANTPSEQRSIDGTPWIDSDGKNSMIYCHECTQIQDGCVRAVEMTDDWSAKKGESVLLFKESEAPWGRPYSQMNYVTDGPFITRTQSGKLQMIWSSFGKNGDYAIGVAVSESGTVNGPWQHLDKTLFGNDGGHGMVFRDFSGNPYLILHQPNKKNMERAHLFKLNEDIDGFRLED